MLWLSFTSTMAPATTLQQSGFQAHLFGERFRELLVITPRRGIPAHLPKVPAAAALAETPPRI